MLSLGLETGESVVIDTGVGRVAVLVTTSKQGAVRLAFAAPDQFVITRTELLPPREREEVARLLTPRAQRR